MDKKNWEEISREAFEDYLVDIRANLGAGANFRDIEQAMLKYSPEMMRKTAEALANAEDFSPSKKAAT
jgi:hypothetical protein